MANANLMPLGVRGQLKVQSRSIPDMQSILPNVGRLTSRPDFGVIGKQKGRPVRKEKRLSKADQRKQQKQDAAIFRKMVRP